MILKTFETITRTKFTGISVFYILVKTLNNFKKATIEKIDEKF